MSYAIVHSCPVPEKFAPFLRRMLADSGAVLQSCYRGADAEALLRRCGKSSQADLWNAWLRKAPGANPANPPGYSTHELRNDGAAYAVPRGAKLKWWQVGIDIDDAHVQAFIKAAARHGWVVTRTYPSSISEYHHVNLRRMPIWKRAIKHLKRR